MSHDRSALLPAVRSFLSTPKQLLIDGEWVDAKDGRTFATIDPSTEEVLVQVAQASAVDADRAVVAARNAFESPSPWSRMTPRERSHLLWRIGDMIDERAEEFAQLESLDNGKSLASARGDVGVAAELFRYFAGWATKMEGTTIPMSVPGRDFHAYTRREAIGVVAGIVPWNFPLTMAAFKVIPAITAGNTVVLKPAEQTPLTALRLGELLLEAGVPAGVVNVLPGFGDAGAALVDHPGVDKVAFTGSTEVGKKIAAGASKNLKKVSLELGGKAPNIIFADADLEAAIAGAALAGYFNEGQCCVNGSRLYVQRAVFDEVIEGVAAAARAIKVGDGFDPATTMGPLVSQEQHEKVMGYVRGAVADGATINAGSPDPAADRGYFCSPTLITGVTETMAVQTDEIFGPVVTAIPFDTEEEVVAAANNTVYGLAAGVWSKDIGTAHRVGSKLRAGTVWLNTWHADDVTLPRGGFKQSGWGRELGSFGLDDYTELKTVIAELR
ncbi:aldehyde dehydrogenase family protein [Nocardioides sp. MAH-18]|uniref:Aldehyde dehydrogenase family protein n=1 Tax=Nocardioides agri TaxID=2682843 RepID=A0A6L6XSZ1_9ACTN|nr:MULTISPECIES: aldehyde dehydrogenase family protein [unclassified Nocardioides]MBA2955019.1 aldehyde dehydrogenase family protein [Nocardioides sp. CGMCC 1.13656]MVQ49873.1 aldehyde dehydrogenase family protein [Nocardioides sp. MAH-18]